MRLSAILDNVFLQRLVLATNPLGANGEQTQDLPTQGVVIEGIVGSPEGRSLGNPGDVRIQYDEPQIWQKITGDRTTTGWAVVADGSEPGPQGAVGNEGDQGPYGTNDAFDNILRNINAGVALTGARASLGIPNGFTGAMSQPPLVAGTRLSTTPRTRFTTTAALAQAAAIRSGLGMWWRGNAAGLGGFDEHWTFALASFSPGFRAFAGFRALVTLIPNVDPSTLVNIIGLGLNAAGTQWSIMHNDAAGAATVIPLGASFNVDPTHLLDLRLFAAANAATVNYEVTNLETGAVAAGSIAADLPAAAAFLSSHIWANTGTAAAALLLDVGDIEAETPTPTP